MRSNRARAAVAAALADAFRAGEWEPVAMAQRGRAAVATRRRKWLDEVARAVRSGYPDGADDRPRELADFVEACPPFRAEWRRDPSLRVRRWHEAPTAMAPAPGPWPVRPLPDVGAVRAWLGLDAGDLAWFADVRSRERTVDDERLRHYRYTWVPKRGGGRLIEAPKPRLKAIQRRILEDVLSAVPVHASAHGFQRGRSVRTYVEPHLGRPTVLHLDLESFFATIAAGRLFGIFRTAGYPEPVAHLLTGLTTNAVPAHAVRDVEVPRPLLQLLRAPHLPQGAPTSPALANLVANRLDRRLNALAASLGASYTRYADDLVLSGGTSFAARADGVVATIRSIAREEGFRLNEAKTTLRRQHQRQRVAGVVINERPNLARPEYDRLRALLHNASLHGSASQNRAGHPQFRAHVLGRISWVASLHPERGEKLRRAFDLVDW